jgi:hypothetical protein
VFRLGKWYMDCVAADGTALIAYWARLAWGVVRFRYAATLVRRDGSVSETATLLGGREPWRETDGIAWRCGPLRIAGRWRSTDCLRAICDGGGSERWRLPFAAVVASGINLAASTR